jgi:hypothetical protein
MRAIRILDPVIDRRGLVTADIWDKDPIHPKVTIYNKMAAAAAKM